VLTTIFNIILLLLDKIVKINGEIVFTLCVCQRDVERLRLIEMKLAELDAQDRDLLNKEYLLESDDVQRQVK